MGGGDKAINTGQEPHKVGNSDVVASNVDLHVVGVQIQGVVWVGIHGPGQRVARTACHIIRKHEDDAAVRYAQAVGRQMCSREHFRG